MKAFKEDWSAESMPLQKAKEPKGKLISSVECVLCEKQVRTIDGKMVAHECVLLKSRNIRRREDEE
jgi:hypothetical protein